MDSKRKRELKNFEKLIGIEFDNIELLNVALTHSSYANQLGLSYNMHNERLEFLGDSVLSLVISEHIFKKFRSKHEGKLTRIRAAIVCEGSLADMARSLKINEFLDIGKGEELSGGRKKDSLLADACEAVIAAIYLDRGYERAKKFILSNLEEKIIESSRFKNYSDYKSRLQEYVQRTSTSTIKYIVVNMEGPDHNKTFEVDAYLDNTKYGSGKGKSKKEAEQIAAMQALKTLGVEINE